MLGEGSGLSIVSVGGVEGGGVGVGRVVGGGMSVGGVEEGGGAVTESVVGDISLVGR